MMHPLEAAPSAKELAERGLDALTRRDLHALLEIFDPEVVVAPLLTGPDTEVYHGREGAKRWLTEIWATWESYRATLRWAREVDESTAVVELIAKLRRYGSEVELETTAYGVLEHGGTGRIRSWRFFATEQEAFDAAESSRASDAVP